MSSDTCMYLLFCFVFLIKIKITFKCQRVRRQRAAFKKCNGEMTHPTLIVCNLMSDCPSVCLSSRNECPIKIKISLLRVFCMELSLIFLFLKGEMKKMCTFWVITIWRRWWWWWGQSEIINSLTFSNNNYKTTDFFLRFH